MRRSLISLALVLAIAPTANAQHPPSPKKISAADRHAVIESLATQLQAHYVFPEVASKLATQLRARDAGGAYAGATTTDAFADALAKDLRSIGEDGHFQVMYAPGFHAPPPGVRSLPTAAEMEEQRKEMASYAYGLDSIARLPGNVGYLEVRGFGPTELVGDAMSAAMTVLAGTDALILDLRRNGGGEPASVAYLMSHFFALGDERHLNDIYKREDESTRQYWTAATAGPRYTKPVYVLTSARTFSGGEEFAYDMQTQKRATLVGEVTGGGANPGDMYAIAHDFAAFIPFGRSINPITHTNWEHTGVKPDVAAAAAQAKSVAYASALRGIVATTKDADERAELQDLISKVETGKEDPPNYAPPHH